MKHQSQFIYILLLLLLPLFGITQDIPTTSSPSTATEAEDFEIGGITVKGVTYADKSAIIKLSGLKVGQRIQLPGEEVSDAIRKLWELDLFNDVEIVLSKKVAKLVYLDIVLEEQPRLATYGFKGIPKRHHDDLQDDMNRYMRKGTVISKGMLTNAIEVIKRFYIAEGYLDVVINVVRTPNDIIENGEAVVFDIDRKKRVKVIDINFNGNTLVSNGKLRKKMGNTKRVKNWFKKSKFIEEDFDADKKSIIAYYNSLGYRDARITKDSVSIFTDAKGRSRININIDIYEGAKYKFGEIAFKGNTIYNTKSLKKVLGIQAGDPYNEEILQMRLNYDPNGRDISSLYLDNGYLFFGVKTLEKSVANNEVDLEILITEGTQATIGKVVILGNDRTNEHVIRRELRVKPGAKFSRSDLLRSQREIIALNYFNPEALEMNTPVNPQAGTVDIIFKVEERPSDQLELSAGWGGLSQGLLGTLGVTFSNFAIANLFKPESWRPLPVGDGQRLQLRAQTNGRFYQSYNFSFTEPWLGGKKPKALTLSASHSRITNGQVPESSLYQQLAITGLSVGLGTRLRWPDDYFTYNVALNYQNMDLVKRLDFSIPTGNFHNLSIVQSLSRVSIDHPIFPQSGSKLSLGLKLTIPYSLFNGDKDFTTMDPIDKFKWVEYHKWDFKGEWYKRIAKNFVFKGTVKMGFLGYYNKDIGLSPFERYRLGGDGLSNFAGIQGLDIITLRGYNPEDVSSANTFGAALYNKYSMELRYLISPNPNATIFVLGFLEGGNAWNSFKEYRPFDLQRSTGVGLRIFLPMFGTLGFDYGLGFDKNLSSAAKWTEYGRFSIVMGFEPE